MLSLEGQYLKYLKFPDDFHNQNNVLRAGLTTDSCVVVFHIDSP